MLLWDMFCLKNNVPVGEEFIAEMRNTKQKSLRNANQYPTTRLSSVGAASSAAPTGNIVVALKNINNGNHYRINHQPSEAFCQSSSYVPIKKVKEWSWESFWLLQGVFAWLVFPLLGALLGVPQESSLFDLWGTGGAGMSIFYGILWGVGGLTFGLSMRYLGVAFGQSIALGTCAGFGTLFPLFLPEQTCLKETDLFFCWEFVSLCQVLPLSDMPAVFARKT